MVLVEAMAAGTPVVTTDCPGGPRWICEDGRAGLVVPVGDPSALAEAIRLLMCDSDLRRKLREAGLARAREFHPRAIAQRYLEVVGLQR